jgi:hypothetical protein
MAQGVQPGPDSQANTEYLDQSTPRHPPHIRFPNPRPPLRSSHATHPRVRAQSGFRIREPESYLTVGVDRGGGGRRAGEAARDAAGPTRAGGQLAVSSQGSSAGGVPDIYGALKAAMMLR